MKINVEDDEVFAKLDEAKAKKQQRFEKLRNTNSFKMMESVAKYMDNWYLDPLIGLVSGFGDVISTLVVLPSIYFCLVHARSIPLTLAVVFNSLKDAALGMIPFFIGDILDAFYKSNHKNLKMIIGYVQGDEAVVSSVRKKAVWSALGIALMCVVIYFLVGLVVDAGSWVLDFLNGKYAK